MFLRHHRASIALATVMLACSIGVAAQSYPAKPVRIIEPYPPGGVLDSLVRAVAQKLGDNLGQPFVVDNRPGADGIIGTEIVARAQPDGYTLLIGITGSLTINPNLYTKLPYRPLEDFEPISLAVMTPYSTGATIKDLVNEALLVALRDGRDIVTWNDVVRARYLRKVGEHEHVDFIERERHAIAIHEACHAVAAYLRRKDLVIDFVSIEPGGSYLGMVSSTFDDETFLRWRSSA